MRQVELDADENVKIPAGVQLLLESSSLLTEEGIDSSEIVQEAPQRAIRGTVYKSYPELGVTVVKGSKGYYILLSNVLQKDFPQGTEFYLVLYSNNSHEKFQNMDAVKDRLSELLRRGNLSLSDVHQVYKVVDEREMKAEVSLSLE